MTSTQIRSPMSSKRPTFEMRHHITPVYCANLVVGLLGLVSVPISLHFLGPKSYGIVSIYTILAAYTALADAGISKNFLRLLSSEEDPGRKLELTRIASGLYVGLSVALIASIPLLLWLVPKYLFPVDKTVRVELQLIVVLSVFEYLATIPTNITQSYCLSRDEFGRYSRFTLTTGLIRHSLLIATVIAARQPMVVVLVLVARRLLEFFLARAMMYPLPLAAFKPRFIPVHSRNMLGLSSRFALAQVLHITSINTASVIANWQFGLEGLGVFRALFDVATKVWFFSNGIGVVIYPKLARAFASAEKRMQLAVLLPRWLSASWVAYNALAIAGGLIAPHLLRRVGMSEAIGPELFGFLLLGSCLNAHATMSLEVLQASKRPELMAGVCVFATTMVIAVALTSPKSWGLVALGMAWLLGQLAFASIADVFAVAIPGARVRSQFLPALLKVICAALSFFVAGSWPEMARGWSLPLWAIAWSVSSGILLMTAVASKPSRSVATPRPAFLEV